MNKTLVYDVPTRVFHWLFAFLFISAFFIAKTFDDDSAQYPFHMLMGMTMSFMVLLRIVWGIFGSKYALLSSFKLSPVEVIKYFKGILTGQSLKYLGHNPASSWAALLMMGLTLGLGLTGYLMVNGTNKEFFEEIHELFANAFVVIVIAHVAGIVLHTLRHKEMIGLSMVSGKKDSIPGEEGIASHHSLAGLVMIILVGLFIFNLKSNYDPQKQSLNFFGTNLQLGENEENEGQEMQGAEGESGSGKGQNEEEDDDDKD